jgi:hypothetical protein
VPAGRVSARAEIKKVPRNTGGLSISVSKFLRTYFFFLAAFFLAAFFLGAAFLAFFFVAILLNLVVSK